MSKIIKSYYRTLVFSYAESLWYTRDI